MFFHLRIYYFSKFNLNNIIQLYRFTRRIFSTLTNKKLHQIAYNLQFGNYRMIKKSLDHDSHAM
jgi:hypothetical protein